MERPILTAQAMQAADRRTIDSFGIPGFTLMETAGREAVTHMISHWGSCVGRLVWVLAGKGNNGGDGLVVARVLYSRGARVRVITLASEARSSPDTVRNLRLLQQLSERATDGRLSVEAFASMEQLGQGEKPDWIVDALLGTGLTRTLAEPIRSMVTWINAQALSTVALDVPTGIDSDTGRVHGVAVQAHLTVAMAATKVGLLINAGQHHAGHVEVVEIGIPDFLLQEAAQEPGCAWQVTDDTLRHWLPQRGHEAHKYNAGMVLAVVGGPGYTGAATMASLAASRIGAGYVVCATPKGLQPLLAQKLTDIATVGVPETEIGTLALEALPLLQDRLAKASALLVGCGMGRHAETSQAVHRLITETEGPGVLDADGLYALVGHTHLLKQTQTPWILTPHWGELKRLVGTDVALDQKDRVRLARTYAQAWQCVLILKGLPSVVGWPDGRVFINATGNPALATAGTGDVLAGLCAGLLAQGLSPQHAALAALHIGGAAADQYIEQHAPRSLMASDLIDQLPTLLHRCFA